MKLFVAGVFAAFFDLLRRSGLPLTRAALILYVLPQAVLDVGWPAVHERLHREIDFSVYGMVRLVTNALAMAVYIGVAIEIVRATAAATPAKPEGWLRSAAANFFLLSAACLGFQFGSLKGGILFILPACLFAVVFFMALSVHADQKRGILRAFLRLRALTQRRRWNVFIAWLALAAAVLPVAYFVVGYILSVAANLAVSGGTGPFETTIVKVCMAGFNAVSGILIALALVFSTAACAVLQRTTDDKPVMNAPSSGA